jgi:hypothetical protein
MKPENSTPIPNEDAKPAPREQIAELVDDFRALAEAEWDYARARLSYSGGVVRKAGLLAILALAAASGAIIALILGTLLVLAQYIGPIIATILVVLFFSLAAYLLAIYARKTAKNLGFSGQADD